MNNSYIINSTSNDKESRLLEKSIAIIKKCIFITVFQCYFFIILSITMKWLLEIFGFEEDHKLLSKLLFLLVSPLLQYKYKFYFNICYIMEKSHLMKNILLFVKNETVYLYGLVLFLIFIELRTEDYSSMYFSFEQGLFSIFIFIMLIQIVKEKLFFLFVYIKVFLSKVGFNLGLALIYLFNARDFCYPYFIFNLILLLNEYIFNNNSFILVTEVSKRRITKGYYHDIIDSCNKTQSLSIKKFKYSNSLDLFCKTKPKKPFVNKGNKLIYDKISIFEKKLIENRENGHSFIFKYDFSNPKEDIRIVKAFLSKFIDVYDKNKSNLKPFNSTSLSLNKDSLLDIFDNQDRNSYFSKFKTDLNPEHLKDVFLGFFVFNFMSTGKIIIIIIHQK